MAFLMHWTHLRPRRSRLATGTVIALAVAAAAAGCTSSAATTTSSLSSANSSALAVTAAQAREIFDQYLAANAKAEKTNDPKLALSVVTEVQQSILAETVAHRKSLCGTPPSSGAGCLHSKLDYDQYAYGLPAFYLPEQTGYPRFFVADVTQRVKGTAAAGGTATGTTELAGAQVPVDDDVLMVFEQAHVTIPWRLASISRLAAGQSLPPLATGKDGYIPQVPLTATTLFAQPAITGPLQAAVVDDGPASSAAKAVATGPLTTGLYQGAFDRVEGLTVPYGDVYRWYLDGGPYPTVALRTASGGALVLYSMYLNSTVSRPEAISKAALQTVQPIVVPPAFLPLLPAAESTPRRSLWTQQLLSFAAIDPPAGPAKVSVIAIGGGPNYAVAS